MTQKEINQAFRKMYHSFEPKEQYMLKIQILNTMNWTENQLKNRLTGRTNVRSYEVESICTKCRINIDAYFPGLNKIEVSKEENQRSENNR